MDQSVKLADLSALLAARRSTRVKLRAHHQYTVGFDKGIAFVSNYKKFLAEVVEVALVE